jgi:hypothetical protein
LASHISQRETIYHFPYPKYFTNIDYVVVDLLEYFPPYWLPRQEDIYYLRRLLLDKDFRLKFWEDGILLFQKRQYAKNGGFLCNVNVVKEAEPKYVVNLSFDGRLLLKGYNAEYVTDHDGSDTGYKFRMTYYWQVLEDFDKKFSYSYFGTREELNSNFIVVDKFKNTSKEFRVVHLPIYLLYPSNEWKAGEIIKEEFEFFSPENVFRGDFNWKIGIFAVPKSFFIETGKENLLPETKLLDLGIASFKKDIF